MITNTHKPIMVKEISSFLNKDKELSILDCTFGGGGHTISFLDLGHRVTAIDEDLNAQEIAKDIRKQFNKFNFFKMFKPDDNCPLPPSTIIKFGKDCFSFTSLFNLL